MSEITQPLTQIHIVECPHTHGEHDAHPAPLDGDVVELETPTGFVRAVDPVTRLCTDERRRFRIGGDHTTLTAIAQTPRRKVHLMRSTRLPYAQRPITQAGEKARRVRQMLRAGSPRH